MNKDTELLDLETWFNTLKDVKPVKIGYVKIGKQVYATLQYEDINSNDLRLYIVVGEKHVPKYWLHKRFVLDNKEYILSGFYPATLLLNSKWAKYWSTNDEMERVKAFHPFGANMLLCQNTILEHNRKVLNVTWVTQ